MTNESQGSTYWFLVLQNFKVRTFSRSLHTSHTVLAPAVCIHITQATSELPGTTAHRSSYNATQPGVYADVSSFSLELPALARNAYSQLATLMQRSSRRSAQLYSLDWGLDIAL